MHPANYCENRFPSKLLGIEDLTPDQINSIHALARKIDHDAEILGGYASSIKPGMYEDLKRKKIILAFEQESTRTIESFYTAAKSLDAEVEKIDLNNSSRAKNESLRDTFKMYENYGVDLIVYRGNVSLEEADLSNINIPVINAGDKNQHPTQALLDSYVMAGEAGIGDIRELAYNVLFVGHTQEYRAAHSLALLLNGTNCKIANLIPSGGHAMDDKWLYGCKSHPFLQIAKGVKVYGLGDYPYPLEKDIDNIEYFLDRSVSEIVDGDKLRRAREDRREYIHTLSELVKDKDIIYLIRPTIEGEQAIIYGLTPEFVDMHAKSTMKIMHPLPRDENRNELDMRFDLTARDLYTEKQPRAGVRIRQALMALMLGNVATESMKYRKEDIQYIGM